jgi:2-polyprenyl-3-methyl-5-hydroxy-6-metoxy-1,4-benzoquinol methylase
VNSAMADDKHDATTLDFYAREADAYTTRGEKALHEKLQQFLSQLPPEAKILELGCGAGQDSEVMIAEGFDVHPTDGTAEIAQAAALRLGIPVGTLLFDDIDASQAYHGIWANACLLHVPRAALGGIVGRIHTALKDGGVFYASFKAGEQEGRDQFDRYFNYPSESWLRDVYAQYHWASLSVVTASGSGYDKKPTQWLQVTAVKP